MTDKHILLKLSTEELAVLEQLAQEAGYPSVNQFARARVEAALGGNVARINDTPSVPKSAQAGIKRAALALKRMHKELKVFIKESMTEFQDSALDAIFEPPAVETSPSKTSFEQYPVPDALEELAARVFAKPAEPGLRTASGTGAGTESEFASGTGAGTEYEFASGTGTATGSEFVSETGAGSGAGSASELGEATGSTSRPGLGSALGTGLGSALPPAKKSSSKAKSGGSNRAIPKQPDVPPSPLEF